MWSKLLGLRLRTSHHGEEIGGRKASFLLDTGGPVGHLEKTIDRVLRRETAARSKAVGRNRETVSSGIAEEP